MNAKSTAAALDRVPSQMAAAAAEYLVDAWQRSILTWDLLRQRGNQHLEHQKSGKPPVLVFDYEMVLDGRTLTKQARPENVPSLAAVKAAVKRQAFVLAMDEERALAALPQLVPDMEERRRGYQGARIVVSARGTPTTYQEERFRRMAQVLSLDKPARARKPT
jgi:hypothetical protein